MTMNLYDPTNHNGLFDVQGKIFQAVAALNTDRETTIPNAVAAALASFELIADSSLPAWQPIVAGLPSSLSSWQGSGDGLASQLATVAKNLLIQFVAADTPQPNNSFQNAIGYLLAQMIANGDYVTGSTVTATLTAAGSNSAGDPAVLWTLSQGDGQTEQNAIPETINLTVTAAGTTPTFLLSSLIAEGNRLAEDWPLGSGLNLSITATSTTASLLSNGSFEATSYDPNIPDAWIVVVGSPGATVNVTNPEVQTLTISGSPTGGSYLLHWLAPSGINYSTGTILWNATAGGIQSVLQAIPGLSGITVTQSGTAPNYVFTVTFSGVAGDINQLTVVDHLTGGSSPAVTPATVTAGDPGSYKGRALQFASNGSELTEVDHPLVGLTPNAVYFCQFRLRAQGTTTAAGQVTADIAQSVGGSVLNDASGNPNQLQIAATTIPAAGFSSPWFAFRLPPTAVSPVYLRLRISTAVTSGTRIYFDECVVVPAQQLYAGGPWVAIIGGATPSQIGDSWTLEVANNRSGGIQEWYNRAFGMADLGLLLPVAGSNLIPETVLS